MDEDESTEELEPHMDAKLADPAPPAPQLPPMDADTRQHLFPLPAGLLGARVVPGPHWCTRGVGEMQNEGGWGTVVACNRAETIEWAELAIGALENPGDPCGRHPRHFLGAWYPSRSVVVQWDTGRRFMYRAGDGGRYDLAFDVRTVQDFDTIGYLNMLHFVEGALFARCDAATLKHVTTCERAHMCAGLRWLQAGSSVGTVANRLGQMVLWN